MYPVIGLVGLSLVLYLVSVYITRRRQLKLAKEWGCELPVRRHAKWPLGSDFVHQLIQADRTNNLPNHIEDVSKDMGVHTWTQYTLGTELINTNEPKNVGSKGPNE
jgi:hypothetical protein